MPTGPFGFPRLTSIGPFVSSEHSEKIDDFDIIESVSEFDPDFKITSELGKERYWTLWQSKFDASQGITGMWMPEERHMVVNPRGLAHHNQQVRSLIQKDMLGSVLMPWVVAPAMGDWHMDIPASAGGLRQAVSKLDLDVTTWRNGRNVLPKHLWPAVYTCYILDVPLETEVTFLYTSRDLLRTQRMTDEWVDISKTDTFSLAEAYKLLELELDEMPEVMLDREGLMDEDLY